MASKQEAALVELVEQLQAQLLWLPQPKKVLKYIKRLNDLPITADVLVETGVGLIVNGLRGYEEVGALARGLVERWKNLAPIDVDSDSDLDLDLKEQDAERNRARKRPYNFCTAEGNFQQTCKPSASQPQNPDLKGKKQPKPRELEKSFRALPEMAEFSHSLPPAFNSPTPAVRACGKRKIRNLRKKNLSVPTVVHGDKGHAKENSARTDSKSPYSVQKLPNMNDGKPEQQQSGTMLAKRKNISIPLTPHLGDLPLPAEQASRQFSSLGTPLPAKSKKKSTSYHDDEGLGFIGRRRNSKMQVYSGPKCVYQPKLISLHQQCIKVLNNNLDSIFDIGSVPYTVLEPVLEKCTPKQLQRIEEYNHFLIGETNQLWKTHCNRDFKWEQPREFESWRELYLRLQEAREQRLLLLTENIRSSHANKPKGRQTMMAFVNSEAKPPRDIRKRQEKFGTGRVATPEMTRPALYTPTTPYGHSAVQPHAGSNTGSFQSTSASSTASCDSRRTSAKKVAPMMAKTIKAFKNRFSR
ncbi:elongin-A-like [Gracilinanus agilis]|uniref:elongin-A-like n=1 Tax=Gracilinanus agilis TaxID=191870 RepID=UPI001CFC8DB8|nr:elongin-A-like [Gracilinanus agilis]